MIATPPADRVAAQALAQAQLDRMGPDLVIQPDQTIEQDLIWVFFATSRRHAETGDVRDAVPGLGAIAVERATGRVTFLSTSVHPTAAIEEFVRQLRLRG